MRGKNDGKREKVQGNDKKHIGGTKETKSVT